MIKVNLYSMFHDFIYCRDNFFKFKTIQTVGIRETLTHFFIVKRVMNYFKNLNVSEIFKFTIE